MPKVVLAGSGARPYPTLKSIIETAADVVLFGDSVAERVSRHDEDRRTLGEMLAENLSPRSLLTLSRSAHNPDIYLPLLRVMAKMSHRPDTIIIPINLRSFSPQWHLSPDWRFDQEQVILSRYLDKPQEPIPPITDVHYDAELHATFARLEVSYELTDFNTIGDFKRAIAKEPSSERSRAIFVYHYTHRLLPTNQRLINLQACAEIARSIARRVLIYATPINRDALLRFVGPEAIKIVEDNVRTLRNAGLEKFVSWVSVLSEDHFFREDLATEHLNEIGRRRLARLIAGQLD